MFGSNLVRTEIVNFTIFLMFFFFLFLCFHKAKEEEEESLCTIVMCKTLCFKKINEKEVEIISAIKNQKFCPPEVKNRLVIPEYTVINDEYFKIKAISEKAFFQNSLTKILIISELNYIGNYAFSDSKSLLEIDISKTNIKSIPDGCFMNTPMLNSIKLPPTIKRISISAFENTGIIEFIFSEKVTSIGESVFANSSRLQHIDFSKSNFDFLPKFTFANCLSLKQIEFPVTLTKIGEGSLMKTNIEVFAFDLITEIRGFAFESCKKLMKVDLSNSDVKILSESVFSNCISLNEIILPRKLEAIFPKALEGTAILSFSIPQTVSQVGFACLCNCFNLKNVDFSKSNMKEIPDKILANCSHIQTILLSNTITSIGESAFEGCGLRSIDLSKSLLENISAKSFKDCKSLHTINFPQSLKKIGEECFCGSLINRNLDLSQTFLSQIPSKAFYSSNISIINFPRYLTDIHHSAFQYCSNLITINLPMKLREISSSSFANCLNLTSADFSRTSLSYIPTRAFYCCYNLTSILLPDSIRVIESEAFSSTMISKINFPQNLEKINNLAFSNCKSLNVLDLSKSQVSSIESGSFTNCTSLSQIYFSNCTLENIGLMCFCSTAIETLILGKVQLLSVGSFANCKQLKSVDLTQSTLKSINESMFSGCISLSFIKWPIHLQVIDKFAFQNTGFSSLTLPKTLQLIKNGAFSICFNLTNVDLTLTNLTKLPKNCFYNSSNLLNVSLPKSILAINSHCFSFTAIEFISFPEKIELLRDSFENCHHLKEINLSNTQVYVLESGLFRNCFELSKLILPEQLDEIKENVFTNTSITEIKIPYDCKLNPDVFYDTNLVTIDLSETEFTEIPKNLFANTKKLKTIIFPNTLKKINDNVFLNSFITELTIPNVNEISRYAFTCPKLKKIDLSKSNIEVFPPFLFAKCPELENISFPVTLADISANAFQGTMVHEIIFPESVLTIEEESFYNCLQLEYVDMSKTKIKLIDDRAFYNCMKLKRVSWPKELSEIGSDAFANSGITSIILPSSLSILGESCFSQCIYLQKIDFSHSQVTDIPTNLFFNCRSLTNVIFGQEKYSLSSQLFATTAISKIKLPPLKGEPYKLFEKSRTLEVADLSKTGLVRLSERFFGDCLKLRVVSLPVSLEIMSESVFQDCFSLQKVYYCGRNCFDDEKLFRKEVSVYVTSDYPCSSFLGVNVIKIDRCIDVFMNEQ